MDFLSLTQSNWFLVGPVAKVLGVVMNGIYEFLDMFGIASIGLAIILFTIIIKALMLPLSIKQQKFTKLNSIMAPELQQVQKKYANLDKSSPKYNEMLLKQGLELLEEYEREYVPKLVCRNPHELMRAHEVLDILEVSKMIINACMLRRSSSQPLCFERNDYPDMDPAEDSCFITIYQENGEIKSRRVPKDYYGDVKIEYEKRNAEYMKEAVKYDE